MKVVEFTKSILRYKVTLYLLIASVEGYKISQDEGERGLQSIVTIEILSKVLSKSENHRKLK